MKKNKSPVTINLEPDAPLDELYSMYAVLEDHGGALGVGVYIYPVVKYPAVAERFLFRVLAYPLDASSFVSEALWELDVTLRVEKELQKRGTIAKDEKGRWRLVSPGPGAPLGSANNYQRGNDAVLQIKCKKEEKQKWGQAAKKLGVSQSEFTRDNNNAAAAKMLIKSIDI